MLDEKTLLADIRRIRGKPLQKGIRTPDIKKRTHDVLDALWKGGKCSRPEAYCILQMVLGIWQRRRAHIRYLTEQQCRQLINALETGRYEVWKAKAMNAAYRAPITRGRFEIPEPPVERRGLWGFICKILHTMKRSPEAPIHIDTDTGYAAASASSSLPTTSSTGKGRSSR